MNWNTVSLVVLGLTAFFSAFVVALWVSLVIWTFRDMRARTRDAFAQLLAALMVLVLGPFGIILYFILRPRETLAEKYERSLEEEALLQDIEERQICPGCKQPIEPDYVLCPICHTRLRRPCIHCGRLVHPRWSVCPYCAQSQRPVPGIERAGRVTLLDLEAEEELPPAGAIEPQEEIEPAASLEADALPSLEEARYGVPLEPDWEQAEEQVEVLEAAEADDGVELFSAAHNPSPQASGDGSGDAADDIAYNVSQDDDALSDDDASPDTPDSEPSTLKREQIETKATTDRASRRPLSLLRRH